MGLALFCLSTSFFPGAPARTRYYMGMDIDDDIDGGNEWAELMAEETEIALEQHARKRYQWSGDIEPLAAVALDPEDVC